MIVAQMQVVQLSCVAETVRVLCPYLLYWLLLTSIWDDTPRSLVDTCQQLDGTCCNHLQAKMKMKAAGFSEMLVLIFAILHSTLTGRQES